MGRNYAALVFFMARRYVDLGFRGRSLERGRDGTESREFARGA
jgi:hypothetical protein